MPVYAKVVAVTEAPLGTTLAVAAVAGDTSITVDDLGKLDWPVGGLQIGNEDISERKLYTVDGAADEDVDTIDEDDDGDVSAGTLSLVAFDLESSLALLNDYDQDTKVWQYPIVTVKEATVQIPDQEEELVLRIPHELHDKLPLNIRPDQSETVELEFSDGEWLVTDVISQEPAVDGSYLIPETLPATQGPLSPSSASDSAVFFTDAWSNPGNVTTSDDSYATVTGSGGTPVQVPASTGYRAPSGLVNDSSVGSQAWTSPTSAGSSDNVWAKAVGAGAGSGSTSYKHPVTVVDDASVGSLAWSDPELARVDDDDFANAGGSGTTHYLKATNFGVAVPADASIVGVVVEINRIGDVGGVTDNIVRLVRGGVVQGTNQASGAAWPNGTPAYAGYGSSTDTWGLTLTAGDVNASNFGMVLSASVPTNGLVNNVRIKVYYTAPTSQTTQYLKATNFGFSVPVGATITGVSAQVERHAPHDIMDNAVRLVKGGTVSGTDKAAGTSWPVSDAVATYGSTADLWGLSLSRADVNASNFGVVVSATGTGDAFIDQIRLKVNYTTPAPGSARTNSHFLLANDFGFSIPADSTITGITAGIERKASADSGDDFIADNQIRLTKGTSASNSAASSGHWPLSDTTSNYGGDLWGLSWSVDEINASGFGVLVSADLAASVTASIDHIRLTVNYVTQGDASGI